METIIHSCNFCVTNADEQLDIFTEEEINALLVKIYGLEVNNFALDYGYYIRVARKLTEGMLKGFGSDFVTTDFLTPDFEMLTSLRENVYIFSAAKNFQQTKQMSSLLIDPKGNVRTFSEFSKQAKKVFETYNRQYLTAEYNSAIAQGQAASKWLTFERDKDVVGKLKYQTVGDARVRPEHAQLDGIVRVVDDPFWSTFYPPNGWNCRCEAIQVEDERVTSLTRRKMPTKEEVPLEFRFNAGKTKQIFSPAHPYFKVAAGEKEFAKRNFDLPIPPPTGNG